MNYQFSRSSLSLWYIEDSSGRSEEEEDEEWWGKRNAVHAKEMHQQHNRRNTVDLHTQNTFNMPDRFLFYFF